MYMTIKVCSSWYIKSLSIIKTTFYNNLGNERHEDYHDRKDQQWLGGSMAIDPDLDLLAVCIIQMRGRQIFFESGQIVKI